MRPVGMAGVDDLLDERSARRDRSVVAVAADLRSALADDVVTGQAEATPTAPPEAAAPTGGFTASASSGTVAGGAGSGGWSRAASSGGVGAGSAPATVTVSVSGIGELRDVAISPEAHVLPADQLSTLIKAAIADARRNAALRWRDRLEAELGTELSAVGGDAIGDLLRENGNV
ncbi:YbaB/EbfC family nucleoid-associated protein [Catenulispora sp. NL8]|uniref:YbaB/EbfC family nucleoid-associated protein n=1 Tax=Catenulispora pinistramenti TaxID=2705254 RepID=A0ABS5L342_9ACTN|nr:YbaB/EbfC family nucleoid-associated protein [Catenulispora pinistramenti]MBS2552744.1 YbaB/EbfC family nucleoid-associated protein [Catenulispora pinistramenti]